MVVIMMCPQQFHNCHRNYDTPLPLSSVDSVASLQVRMSDLRNAEMPGFTVGRGVDQNRAHSAKQREGGRLTAWQQRITPGDAFSYGAETARSRNAHRRGSDREPDRPASPSAEAGIQTQEKLLPTTATFLLCVDEHSVAGPFSATNLRAALSRQSSRRGTSRSRVCRAKDSIPCRVRARSLATLRLLRRSRE
jgi:hypothetical protein